MVQILREFKVAVEAGTIREDSFMGRQYLVVPVIALVESVIHPSNADSLELALSTEFGKVPSGWNGRPLVLNHPKVQGQPVDASSPSILESYQMGFIFNTRVEDGKLKTDAWIDLQRAEE